MGEDKLVLLPSSRGVPGVSLGCGTWWQPSEELGQCHPSPRGPFHHGDGAQTQPSAARRLRLPQQLLQQPALLPSKNGVSGPQRGDGTKLG